MVQSHPATITISNMLRCCPGYQLYSGIIVHSPNTIILVSINNLLFWLSFPAAALNFLLGWFNNMIFPVQAPSFVPPDHLFLRYLFRLASECRSFRSSPNYFLCSQDFFLQAEEQFVSVTCNMTRLVAVFRHKTFSQPMKICIYFKTLATITSCGSAQKSQQYSVRNQSARHSAILLL